MSAPAVQLRLLGPLGVIRNGAAVTLPRSRKVRALLAYLALGQGPMSRSRLCRLLWDVPNDPRGELRWCLSKLRRSLDDADRHRVITRAPDLIALDLSDCHVDALEIEHALRAGARALSRERLGELAARLASELLEATEIDGNPEFVGWLAATRQRYRAMHVAVLAELTERARGSDEALRHLDAWLQVAPFDPRAHAVMLDALVAGGRVRDAEAHLAAAIRSFEHEGLDWTPLRNAWRGRAAATTGSRELPPPGEPRPGAAPARQRARVAIMPFIDKTRGPSPTQPSVADGLTDDIITRLAKLRVLFVIARGTVHALCECGLGAEEAGRTLNVDYVASGSVRRTGSRLAILVELAEVSTGRIVWNDELDAAEAETFAMLDAIVDRIVATLAEQIEAAECNRAVLKPPSSLDAWESYHRGLWHMYKFTGPDNRHAERLFRAAVELDPTFSRAYAGLSFTHFQNAFLDLAPDHARQIELAFQTAGHSLCADDRDPAAHWAMGRALWLRGVHGESVLELQRSIDLSPNFALGHYTLGFVNSQAGDPHAAIGATTTSRQLSPFDPLQFAMLASRAMAHVRLGEVDEAADWALRATRRPNAHTHILAIAAHCLAHADRLDEARAFVAQIRDRVPGYDGQSFLRAFRFAPDGVALFQSSARRIGLE